MLLNCGIGEDSWVPWTARRSNQSILKEIIPGVQWRDWCWSWNSNTLATWLIGKDPDAGKIWGQEEKGMTQDEMVGWHHWLDGHGFGWTLGVGDGQGGLECCNSWGCKELDTTEQLNWTSCISDWSTIFTAQMTFTSQIFFPFINFIFLVVSFFFPT